jgi:hypothetical protein
MMRRILPVLIVLAVGLALALSFLLYRPLQPPRPAVESRAPAPVVATPVAPPAPDERAEAAKDVARVHATLVNFLTLVKDPHRPPMGDNIDITRALGGGNRLGEVFVPSHDTQVVDGQLVDRWGTPYHFHPRAPDAIDVRSAGPDRTLFTGDDITWPKPAP